MKFPLRLGRPYFWLSASYYKAMAEEWEPLFVSRTPIRDFPEHCRPFGKKMFEKGCRRDKFCVEYNTSKMFDSMSGFGQREAP
jgi:hypothetical protein